jgi:SAM-dependent methyltransferase
VAVGEDFEYRTTDDTYLAMRCRACRVVYLDPRPGAAAFAQIYPANYHAYDFSEEQFGLVHKVRRKLEARRLLQVIGELPASARILDVGCGDGFHLGLLQEFGTAGWTLVGVDLDERGVAAARRKGIDARQVPVEDLDEPAGSFDVALCIMTVEHVADPAALLRSTLRLLKPGGRMVVVTDNTASPDAKLFASRYWGGYHFPRHLYLFDAGNLADLARAQGFEVEQVRTMVSPVNWTYSVRNLLDDHGAPRWLVTASASPPLRPSPPSPRSTRS